MSSFRPLATITVLALVGVFLYAKINETEPPLPEGVDDWAVGTEIELDMGGDDLLAAPTFEGGVAGEPAPTFAAEAPSAPAPTFNSSDTATAAPAWTPPPADAAPAAEVAAAPTFEPAPQNVTETNVADMEVPNVPDLPPLPEMPSEVSGTTGAASSANAPVPDLTLPGETETTAGTTGEDIASTQPPAPAAQAQSSLFSATRLAVQAALDRGELSQALLLLSDWYGDPSLTPDETAEVNQLLSQLAGSVIYSTEPRLEPPYMVQPGERLETIAKEYEVPWQLLAKINGITSADQLQPGQKIKVLRGPFSAVVDISEKTMTLMLDRRYAGKFSLDFDPSITVEEGHWEVKQKLLTPANASLPGAAPTTPTEERSLMLASTGGGADKVVVLRGTMTSSPLSEPAGRILRLRPTDAEDVFDILSLGSKVVIRR